MSDLTKRLREVTRVEKLTSPQQWAVDEAADRIEALEECVRELIAANDNRAKLAVHDGSAKAFSAWIGSLGAMMDAWNKARALLEDK